MKFIEGGEVMSFKQETILTQLGNRVDVETGAVSAPIHMSTAYRHQTLGESTGFDYTRTKNPTRLILEEAIAELEGGVAGFACSSGLAALQLVFSLFKSGDHLIVVNHLYGGTYRLLEHFEQQYDLEISYLDFDHLSDVSAAIRTETKAILLETPTNPLLTEIDIEAVSKITEENGLLLIVDNTFYTPYLQQPLALGADIVVHSATKYLGGHNDVLAGLTIVKSESIAEKLAELHNNIGATLSPFDAWLLMRGMKTLPVRIKQQQENAQTLVKFLSDHPCVGQVFYPGKGGMLSFRLKDKNWVKPFLQELKLISFAESLGGVESFITFPTTQTHADIPEAERLALGIDDTLLRFSVGIEAVEDLITDLKTSFAKLK